MTRYFDASALVKLGVLEAESTALATFVDSHPEPAVTSAVAITEVAIALSRAGVALAERALASRGWLALPGVAVLSLPLTSDLCSRAADLGARLGLRALDAIHVASADAARETLSEVVTYDKAMIRACQSIGLCVASPGA
jgi:predicted nucleic acid-binding protein